MKKQFLALCGLVAVLAAAHGGFAAAETELQAAADAKRINDVHRIAGLVESYRQRRGHYPYADQFGNVPPGYVAVPISVNITDRKLPERYRYPPRGVSGLVLPSAEFEAELRSVLGRDIAVPYDPPRDDPNAPNFYQYFMDGRAYYVSANLYRPTANTRPLAQDFHKYQVGSAAVPSRRIRRFLDIPAAELEAARLAGEAAERRLRQ